MNKVPGSVPPECAGEAAASKCDAAQSPFFILMVVLSHEGCPALQLLRGDALKRWIHHPGVTELRELLQFVVTQSLKLSTKLFVRIPRLLYG